MCYNTPICIEKEDALLWEVCYWKLYNQFYKFGLARLFVMVSMDYFYAELAVPTSFAGIVSMVIFWSIPYGLGAGC